MDAEKDFRRVATATREGTFLEELWALVHHQRKYWLMPIVVVMLLLGVLVILSGTAAAPFIYTLF
jgi:hypothetical protein